MPDSHVVAARALRQALRAFEPEANSGTDCAALAEELAKTEKACAAASVRAASRAAACGAQRGFGNATDWLARISGTSAGQARAVLNTAAALEGLPAGRCWDCHEKKTEADRRAGLLGGKGLVKPSRGKREPP